LYSFLWGVPWTPNIKWAVPEWALNTIIADNLSPVQSAFPKYALQSLVIMRYLLPMWICPKGSKYYKTLNITVGS